LNAKICVDSWAGRREFPCEIMGETKTKYVCRMLGDGMLPRKHVRLGDVVKVPKSAVRIETPDHEREIPRQDKTQEESELPQGREESLVAQISSAVNQAEQLRDQQIQQQYSDQLGVGEIEEAAGVYAERKIEELAEHKLRFEKPELTLEWDKIQHKERQAAIPAIESTQSVGQDFGRSLTLSRVVDEE